MIQGIKAIIFDWGRTIYDKDNEVLFPETREVLEYCSKKYKLVIISLAVDGDIEGRFAIMDKFDIRKYFEFALFHVSDKESLGRNALGNINLPPEQILAVDDRMKRMSWAISRGLKTVWIQKGKFADELPDEDTGQPTHTIYSLKELINLI